MKVDDLGTAVPPRRSFVRAVAAIGVVMILPCVRSAKAAAQASGHAAIGGWAVTVAMVLLFILFPLGTAAYFRARRIFVSSDTISWMQNGRLRKSIRFADMREARVRFGGRFGRDWLNETVFVIGTLSDGRQGTVVVQRLLDATIRPVLQRLAEEVARRPELLANDAERALFEGALRDAR